MVTSGALCRCLCGSGKNQDPLNPEKFAGAEFGPDEELDGDQPPAHVDGLLSYYVLADQPLRGVPIREAELWYLSAEESVEPVTLALYVNGLSFTLGRQELSVSFSPFGLVRNCKFGSTYSNSLNLADFKIFKVSLFTQGVCYYFGVRSDDDKEAEDERSRWVLDISRAMRLVTQSLFPPFRIATRPLAERAATERRILAGYLIHHEDTCVASMLFCELHPHCKETARLIFYENELCEVPMMEICLTEHSICCEKIGINCSCFCIEDHQFATRTLSERKLWLRAISNVKVKLQNHAPTPSLEEVEHYRQAIRDHLVAIGPSLDGRGAPSDALLQRLPQQAEPAPPAPAAAAAAPAVCATKAAPQGGPPPPAAAERLAGAAAWPGTGGFPQAPAAELPPPPPVTALSGAPNPAAGQ